MTSQQWPLFYNASRAKRRSGLRVKDPVLDTTEMIAGLVSCCYNRVNNMLLPVVFDQILKVFSMISRSRVGDFVVGEPTLEFGFVPLVVCY
jgi:hypothetical protein